MEDTFRCWNCQVLWETRTAVEVTQDGIKHKIPVCRECWRKMPTSEKFGIGFEFIDRSEGPEDDYGTDSGDDDFLTGRFSPSSN